MWVDPVPIKSGPAHGRPSGSPYRPRHRRRGAVYDSIHHMYEREQVLHTDEWHRVLRPAYATMIELGYSHEDVAPG
jgi:hypothetical protein